MKLSFEFDPLNGLVNVLSHEGFTEKIQIDFDIKNAKEIKSNTSNTKSRTTKSVDKPINPDEKIVVLGKNNLTLSEDLANKLNAIGGEDRISVLYTQIEGRFFPIICKSSSSSSEDGGNKLTKKLTMSFKGKQRDKLFVFGERFSYKEYKPNIYFLIGENSVEMDDSVFDSDKNIDLEQKASPIEEFDVVKNMLLSGTANPSKEDFTIQFPSEEKEEKKTYIPELKSNKPENILLDDNLDDLMVDVPFEDNINMISDEDLDNLSF